MQVINNRAEQPAASTIGAVGAPVEYTMVPATITTAGITVVVSTPKVAGQTTTAAAVVAAASASASKSAGGASTVTSTTAPGAAGRAMATPFVGVGGLIAAGVAVALW